MSFSVGGVGTVIKIFICHLARSYNSKRGFRATSDKANISPVIVLVSLCTSWIFNLARSHSSLSSHQSLESRGFWAIPSITLPFAFRSGKTESHVLAGAGRALLRWRQLKFVFPVIIRFRAHFIIHKSRGLSIQIDHQKKRRSHTTLALPHRQGEIENFFSLLNDSLKVAGEWVMNGRQLIFVVIRDCGKASR